MLGRLFSLIAAATMLVALPACSTTGVPGSPAEVADKTILDEQGALSVELAYKAARTVVEVAVDAGLIKGELASTIARLDRDAYSAVLAVRSAYDAGNATSYSSAIDRARSIISSIIEKVTGRALSLAPDDPRRMLFLVNARAIAG